MGICDSSMSNDAHKNSLHLSSNLNEVDFSWGFGINKLLPV
jgi:hypothetical protein